MVLFLFSFISKLESNRLLPVMILKPPSQQQFTVLFHAGSSVRFKRKLLVPLIHGRAGGKSFNLQRLAYIFSIELNTATVPIFIELPWFKIPNEIRFHKV